MKIKRRKTRIIKIGKVSIGGNYPVAIQSMAKAETMDVAKVAAQINQLRDAGCEIVRLAVKNERDAAALKEIKRKAGIPVVADIHFSWKLAIKAIESGVDKIRLNPGNIYRRNEVMRVAAAAKVASIPIRVGVNSGSLRGRVNPRAMAESALSYAKMLEGFKFSDIVVSLKASNVLDTVEAYRIMSRLCDYPLHLGVTATGAPYPGAIKSSIAVGSLLIDGIGDTIRVSLTEKPAQEVYAARTILESLELRNFGPEIISCPTCGRCEVNLVKIVRELEKKISGVNARRITRPLKVAVMGCVVNGPGEAKEADIGVAFGKKDGLLFKSGKPVKKINFKSCADILFKEMEKLNA